MKANTTRRALLMSALSLLLCVSMLVGTTFAWFTDSVTSGNNIIQSGTLDVEMQWAMGTEDPASAAWTDASTGPIFNYDLWEPGYVEVRHVQIKNAGSLGLKYQLAIEANGEVSKLADVIDVYYLDPAQQIDLRTQLTEAMKLGTLTDVLDAINTTASGELLPGESDTITLALKMQESAGNEYQGLAIGSDFSIKLVATQLTYESDSFDDQYDKDAMYPVNGSVDKKDGKAATVKAGNVEVTIPAAAPAGVYTLEISPVGAVTDASGNTTVSMDITLLKDGVKVEKLPGIEYPVNVDCGEGLVVVGVDHKGEAVIDYSYNTETGLISFATDSFSPFAYTYFGNVTEAYTADDLFAILTRIKNSAKQQIPGETGNKAYRENAIIVLKNDIVIDDSSKFMYTDSNGAPFHFYGVNGVLDLNGHSIKVTSNALLNGKGYANAVLLFQYSNVDIIGEGSIISENKAKAVFAWANCSVDIYGGTYISNSSERNCSTVYVNNASAKINVYGGTYTETKYAFNAHDNCGNTPVIVLHEGISYADFLKSGTTDVIASDIRGGRIVMADGCELSEYEEDGIAMNKVVAK